MRFILFCTALLAVFSCNNKRTQKEEKKDTVAKTDVGVNNPARPDTIFTGSGTEPFWAVYVINNDKIVYHPADGADIAVPFVAPASPDSITTKYSSANDSVTFELTVIKKDCNNGMSDIVYPYQVNLQINAASFTGCGKQGTF